ncbi:S49 family peptidase [Massilia sp. ZL223]|uniref:S49 family peptidase n=1 Tax=Massilia sp. ZL223 TaxID=2824904 RepID=UPI001B8392F0|nr:S49 family peptidase [Massilia sp. ZL223]MBQ5963388.1 S49 family peptidase [Massilia sp. ZL223]
MSDHTSNDHPGDSRLAANPTVSNWERETLEKLVFATVQERRAARRWGIFFKLSFLLVALLALWAYYDFNFGGTGDESLGRHTALIEINGEIEAEGSGAADTVIPSLNKAFSDSGSAAVVLRIDSPGGSPVQAGIIVDEIQRLKRGYPDKPLYVVVDEICASGGYYIASAADRIYVNKASIVGSVGVLMDSFGFTGTMEKLGVERRLMTAGENKGFLDPFSPQSDKHKAHAQAMLNEIHQQFISVVRAGRGKRLKETPETFSGLYWTGAKAVEMGLADGFGTVDTVARDIVKAEDIVDYTAHEGLPERVLKKFGAAVGENAVKAATRGTLPKLH